MLEQSTVAEPIEIPGGALEGIILDLISVAEALSAKGDEVSAAIINMVISRGLYAVMPILGLIPKG